MRKKRGKAKQDHKFCPVCGNNLAISDRYCIKCGYSFEARAGKKKSKKVKWINVAIVVVILLAIWAGVRLLNGHPVLPGFLTEFLGNSTAGS